MSTFFVGFLLFQNFSCMTGVVILPSPADDNVDQNAKKKADFALGIARVKKADALFDKGYFRDAATEYSKAIDLGVDLPAVFFNRAVALFQIKEFTEARRDCNEAIARGVKERVFAMRAITHMMAGEFQLAVYDYTQAIKNGDGEILVYDRGLANLRLTKFKEALKDFDAAIRIDDKNPRHFRERGITYISLRQYKRGIADMNHAISLNPKDVEAHWGKAEAFRLLGDARSYKEALAKVESLNPNDPRIYVYRGKLCLNENRIDEAITHFKRGLECEKQWGLDATGVATEATSRRRGDLLRYLGKAYLLKGDSVSAKVCLERALNDLSAAIKLQPHDPNYYSARADVLSALGKQSEAQADERKARNLKMKTNSRHP